MLHPRTFVLVACTVLALLGLGPGAMAGTDPYDLTVITSLTGPLAFVGKTEVESLHLVEESVNKSGGIKGRSIHFVVYDDATNPQNAVQLLNQVAAKNVPVVFGPATVATCQAMAPLLLNGPVDLCFSPAMNPAAGSYVFSLGSSLLDAVHGVVTYARTRGWKKIGMISSTDAGGQVGETNVISALRLPENAGLSLVGDEHFNQTDLSVAAQITRLEAAGPDVLFGYSSGTPFATVLRAIKEAGLNLPVVTFNSNETYTLVDAYKPVLPKELYFGSNPSLSPEVVPNGPMKRAILAYQDVLRANGVRVDAPTGSAWDPAELVVSALRKFGTGMTAAQLHEYLTTLRNWNGIYGQYDFVKYPQRGLGVNGIVVQKLNAEQNGWIGVSKLGGAAL